MQGARSYAEVCVLDLKSIAMPTRNKKRKFDPADLDPRGLEVEKPMGIPPTQRKLARKGDFTAVCVNIPKNVQRTMKIVAHLQGVGIADYITSLIVEDISKSTDLIEGYLAEVKEMTKVESEK